MPHRIIDTHVHIWDFDRAEYAWLKGDTSILNRTYAIEEIAEDRVWAGITAGVLVQAANNREDTDWMLEVAARTDWITGVVGWLPLTDPDATAKALTDKYLSHPYFKGVRHLIHDEADPRWLLQDTVIESLGILARHNIPYDVVGVLPAHIETALEVAAKVPSLRMVFDHLNQPPIAAREKYGRWGQLMLEAAAHPGFHMKISGLGTASGNPQGWHKADLEPYISFALEHFGEDRCFCGGDWPVSLLAGSYVRTWQAYREVLTALLAPDAQEKAFWKNAELFYRL